MLFIGLGLQVCAAGTGERAFAEHPGCMPGSLQTVFSNCEVGISGSHSLQVSTPEAQRD